MKLTDKTKKRLTIAGLGVVCVVLVIAIASRFMPETPKDVSTEPSSAVTDAVNPSVPTTEAVQAPEVNAQPIDPTKASVQPADTGDSTGTEQSIQAEVTKPTEPPKEVLTDPSKTPDGEKVDKDKKPESNTSSSTPKGGDKNEKGQVWVPGFGWVDDSGPNEGTTVDGEGDINKQIGIMD